MIDVAVTSGGEYKRGGKFAPIRLDPNHWMQANIDMSYYSNTPLTCNTPLASGLGADSKKLINQLTANQEQILVNYSPKTIDIRFLQFYPIEVWKVKFLIYLHYHVLLSTP